MKRIDWIDATRYIAIVHVVFIHTLDKFWPELLNLWVTPPTSYIPILLNAKVAVLFFCVLLGFFAAKPREFNAGKFAQYTVKRYIQFAFFMLICSAVLVIGAYGTTWLFHRPDELVFKVLSDGTKYNIIYILRDGFLFEDNYNPPMWSMQQFFITSIVCYLLGCVFYRVKPLTALAVSIAAVAVFLLPGSEYLSWIGYCCMGAIARLYVENKQYFYFMEKRGIRWALFLFAWFLYKFPMPESPFIFFLMGIASVILIAVLYSAESVQGFLGRAPLPTLGKIAFGVFVSHDPINSLLASSVVPFMRRALPQSATTLICFVVCVLIATFCAWLLDKAYRKITEVLFRQKTTV